MSDSSISAPPEDSASQLRIALLLGVNISYFAIFMEWLFFITKESIFSTQNFSTAVRSYFSTSLFISVLAAIVILIGAWLSRFAPERFRAQATLRLLTFAPALVASILLLLLIDNFSYTVLRWGIVGMRGYALLAHAVLIVLIFLVCWERLSEHRMFQRPFCKPQLRGWTVFSALLLSTSLVLVTLRAYGGFHRTSTLRLPDSIARRPNVVFIAGDGIEARRLRAYGYERETTPVLDSMLGRALIAKNAFSNSSRTSSSTTSMLNGVLPTTSKMLYPPQTFNGDLSFVHLPGILRRLGYRSLQESVPYFGDADSRNMRNAFDLVNGRSIGARWLDRLPLPLQLAFETDWTFAGQIAERAKERVLQIFGASEMIDPYLSVLLPQIQQTQMTRDVRRVASVRSFIEETDAPFFIHLHLMATHCCAYSPKVRRFSTATSNNDSEYRRNAFDDEILDVDQDFGSVIETLKQKGVFDNTIIVYSSDHGERWNIVSRVPLIFFFPQGEHRGEIERNVQLADVAPTILDYIGIPVPKEMEGQSLLKPEAIAIDRPIFSVADVTNSFTGSKKHPLIRLGEIGKPWFGMKALAMTICNKQFRLELPNERLEERLLEPAIPSCEKAKSLNKYLARRIMLEHLQVRGYGL